jgi:RNA polymerase sigma-32 factor
MRADDSTTTFGALLPDPNAADPEADLIARQTQRAHREALAAALARLPEREREILRARRLRERPLTLQALSERFRVSRERIRQLENNALRKLGADLRASAPELDGALPDPASVDLYQVPSHGTAAQA